MASKPLPKSDLGQPAGTANDQRRTRSVLFSSLAILLLLGIVLALAGRPDYVQGWLFAGLNALLLALIVIRVPELPTLMKERARPGPATKWWDRVFWALFGPLNLAILVVAGLDGGRYRWTPPLSPAVYGVAALLYLTGAGLHFWAIRANPFYSSTVSIQAEKGQRAVAGGPYRYVRHPGYAGILGMMAGLPVFLGSLWGLLPFSGLLVVVLGRTALEDRALKSELPGYAGYAATVRFRILPGFW